MKPLKRIFPILILGLLSLTGCDLIDRIFGNTDDVVQVVTDVLDKGINSLNDASADWQDILNEVIDELPDEVQSTVSNEVSNLMNRAIAATGAEFRCNADFLVNRLKQGLVRIKAKFLGQTPPALEPQLCQVVPLAIDMELEQSRRNKIEFYGYDFDQTQIQVLLENTSGSVDVTRFLDQPTHYHMTLNLGGSGVQIGPNARRLVLRWENRNISTIAILQPSPDICETRLINKRPSDITYIPPHTNGDREFDGNGPNVNAYVRILNFGNQVKARIYMKAKETKSDWTTAEGYRDFVIYTPDPGWRVNSVVSSDYASFFYKDKNHHNDEFAGSGPVQKWTFVGDTGGKEAGTTTRVTVRFNSLRFEVKENRDCVPASTIRAMELNHNISTKTLNQIKKQNQEMKFLLPEEMKVDLQK